MERHAAFGEISRQHIGRKARLLLVEIDRDDVEVQRGAIFERKQDVEEPIAVLAARQADHDAVARFDHREIPDRLAHQAPETFLELVRFERVLARIARSLGQARGWYDGGGDIFHRPNSSGRRRAACADISRMAVLARAAAVVHSRGRTTPAHSTGRFRCRRL